MRRLILWSARALLTAACGGCGAETQTPDPTIASTATSTTAAPPSTEASTTTTPTEGVTTTTGTVLADGHPLVIASIDFEGNAIVLGNGGDEPYDLTGHYPCNRPSYAPVPAETLPPGGIIEIRATSLGVSPDDGELGLYTSNSFGSADAIVRKVQWGSDSHGRTSVAGWSSG